MACLKANISRITSGCVNASISEIGTRLKASCSIVCDVNTHNTGYFLIVEPQFIWLTEANGFEADFEVKSNTNWRIE